MYLLRLALRSWRVAPFSQIFTAIAVGFLLLFSGFLFWMQRGLQPVVRQLQREQVITAYIDGALDAADTGRALAAVRAAVGADAEVKLVEGQGFVDQLQGQYPDLSRELLALGSEMPTVIPRYISVTGYLADDALERVRAVGGIASAESSRARHQAVVGAIQAVRWVVRLLFAGMAVALATGLIHLSKMNNYLYRDALAVLKLWGGGPLALRTPAMISGLSVGLLGGTLAAAGWIALGAWSTQHVRDLSPLLQRMPLSFPSLAAALWLAGLLTGAISGILASATISVRSERG